VPPGLRAEADRDGRRLARREHARGAPQLDLDGLVGGRARDRARPGGDRLGTRRRRRRADGERAASAPPSAHRPAMAVAARGAGGRVLWLDALTVTGLLV
jgi:hypothetical protein